MYITKVSFLRAVDIDFITIMAFVIFPDGVHVHVRVDFFSNFSLIFLENYIYKGVVIKRKKWML